MHRLGWVLGSLVVVLCIAEDVKAAPCDCDHVVDSNVGIVDASALGVTPGQTVCVRGGPAEYLRLQNFAGTEQQKILVRNCEGVVDISNDDRGYALTADNSHHLHITGTGDENAEYGFRARAARTGPDYSGMSVSVGDLSSDIELDHVEAYEAGFAGINWKTEPRCDGSANLGTFVMYGSQIHHNYVHDTGGEGLYFGSTGYGGREYSCDGQQVLLYPHEHHGADIHDNIFENTGWDGAQIGVTPVDCAFYRNTIRNVGLGGELYQQQGLQIGGASACDVWGNTLMDGPTNGIFVFGADDTLVYNNLVINFGDAGIYANDQDHDLAAAYRFAHNTVIVGSGTRGLAVFGSKLGPGWAFNNFIAGPQPLGVGNEVVDFVQMANVTADSPDAFGFVDPANRDFHLLETSSLRDVGVAPPVQISDDLDGVLRDATPDVGAFEWSPEPPPSDDTTGGETTADPDTGEPTSSPDPDTTNTPTGSASDSASSNPDDDDDSGAPPNTTDSDPDLTTGDTGSDQDDTMSSCGCTTTATPPWLLLLLLTPRRRVR